MSDNPNGQDIRIPIVFDLEAAQASRSLDAVQKLTAKVRQEVETFANKGGLGGMLGGVNALSSANSQVDELGLSLETSARKAQILVDAIGEVRPESQAFDSLNSRLEETQKQAAQAVDELVKIPAVLKETEQAAQLSRRQQISGGRVGTLEGIGQFEGLATNARGLAQSGGAALGLDPQRLTGLLSALELGGDTLGTIDAIPRAIAGFGELKQGLSALKVASGASTLSFGALGVALIALGPAIALLNKATQEASRPLKDLTSSFDREIEILEFRNRLSGQTQEQIDTEARKQQQLIAIYQEQVNKAEAGIAASKDLGDKLIGDAGLVSDALTKALDLAGYDAGVLSDKLPELQANLETARQKLAELNDPLVQLGLAAQEAQKIFLAQLEFEQQRLQLIESGTPDQIAGLRNQAELEREAIENTFAGLGKEIEDQVFAAARESGLEEELSALFRASDAFGDDIQTQTNAFIEFAQVLGIELPTALFNTLGTFNEQVQRMNELGEQIDFLNDDDLADAIAARDKEQQQLQALSESTKEVTKGTQEATTAIDALTKANEAATKAENERQKAIDEIAKVGEQISALESDRAAKLAEQSIRDAQAATEAGLRAQIAAAKEVEQADEKRNKILATQQDAQQKEVDALQKHNAQKAREQAAFDLEQKRRVEDLNSNLEEAAADRDVRSFLRLQREGQKELDRAEEDNDIKQQTEADSLNDQLREIRQSANERIRVEQEAGRQRVTQSQRLEQQLAAFQANSAQQNQARARLIEEQGYQQRLNALRAHMQQITSELVTSAGRGLASIYRVVAGAGAGAIPIAPQTSGAGASGLAALAVTVNVQQQNVGRVATPQDVDMARTETRNLGVAVGNMLTRALANTRR